MEISSKRVVHDKSFCSVSSCQRGSVPLQTPVRYCLQVKPPANTHSKSWRLRGKSRKCLFSVEFLAEHSFTYLFPLSFPTDFFSRIEQYVNYDRLQMLYINPEPAQLHIYTKRFHPPQLLIKAVNHDFKLYQNVEIEDEYL